MLESAIGLYPRKHLGGSNRAGTLATRERGHKGRGRGRVLRTYCAGATAPFDEPLVLRLLRCAADGAVRVGAGGVWASGTGASPLSSCSIARKRPTFFTCCS